MIQTKKALIICGFLIGLFCTSQVMAAWFDFASQDGVPDIAELRIGNIEMESLPELLTVHKDELEAGSIIFRGLAEISQGKIGIVQLSFDGGNKWQNAEVGSSGLFNYEFKPQIGKEYQFRIKAIATTGKASDPEFGGFPFIVKQANTNAEIRSILRVMLDEYMRRSNAGFMSYVAEEFEGNLSALEDAIQDDFRYLSNIIIKVNITRVVSTAGRSEIFFTFDRTVRSTATGRRVTDQGTTSMSFIRTDKGYRLVSLASPLIFGLSGGAEVATSVESDAVGQKTVTVTDQGHVVVVTQQETIEETSEQDETLDSAQTEQQAQSTADVITETGDTSTEVVGNSDIRTGTESIACAWNYIADPGGNTPLCPGLDMTNLTTVNESPNDLFNGTHSSSDFGFYLPSGGNCAVVTSVPFSTESDVGVLDTGKTSFSQVSSVSTNAGDYSSSTTSAGGATHPVNGRVYAIRSERNDVVYALVQPGNMACTDNGNTITFSGTYKYEVQKNGTANFH